MKLPKRKLSNKTCKQKKVKFNLKNCGGESSRGRSLNSNRKKWGTRKSIKGKSRKTKGGQLSGGADETDPDLEPVPTPMNPSEVDNTEMENDKKDGKIININEAELTEDDIARINDYLNNKKYKNEGFISGMSSQLSNLINNPEFIDYLKMNNILNKYELNQNPKKNIKIVFYSSKSKKNSVRKYPYFKVFIEDGNTMVDNINQVDDMLAYIVDPNIKQRSDMFKRTIDIDIKDLSKMVEKQLAEEKQSLQPPSGKNEE